MTTVYLDDRVQECITSLHSIIKQRVDWSEFDDVDSYICDVKRTVETTIKRIKEICREEMKI